MKGHVLKAILSIVIALAFVIPGSQAFIEDIDDSDVEHIKNLNEDLFLEINVFLYLTKSKLLYLELHLL